MSTVPRFGHSSFDLTIPLLLCTAKIRKTGESLQKTNTICSQSIHEVARNHGYRMVDVPPDGSCALHAIADQLRCHGVTANSISLRGDAVSFLRHNPQLIDENFMMNHQYASVSSYIDKQSKQDEWCDEILLRAVSMNLKRPIRILHDNGHQTAISPMDWCPSSPQFTSQEMLGSELKLRQIAETHYVSLHSMEETFSLAGAGDDGVIVESTSESLNQNDGGKNNEPRDECQLPDIPAVWNYEQWQR